MEAKKLGLVLGIITIVAAFTRILHILEAPEVQHALLGEFNFIIPGMLKLASSPGKDQQEKPLVILPNLTSCHESMGRSDLPVYCCPPMNQSNVAIIDFQFPDPSLPLRVRRPTHLLDDNYISKYKKAITIMKSLPDTDPRSYTRQANLHCLFCTGAYNQQGSNSPLNIHRSWLFFPWHRMLIYFHERILGSLIGDDTFALPFWPWDIPEGMVIPEMYMKAPFFHEARDFSHFPPSVVDLDYSCTTPSSEDYRCFESGLGPEDQVHTNLVMMYNQMVAGAKKMELFMGCPYKAGKGGSCNGPGTIELAPHNTVHKWVGSNLNPGSREDMGVFYSAARDPIFYPHHANIDRLWDVWRTLHGNKVITDPDWLDSSFFFYDEKLQLNRIKIRDVLSITKLQYAYEKVDFTWLNNRPKPSVPLEVARNILRMRQNAKQQQLQRNGILSSNFSPHGRFLDATLRTRVNRPKVRRTKKEKEEEEEILVVHGIDIPEERYVKFDVYVNVVNETIMNPRFREFAGTFVHIDPGVTRAARESNIEVFRKKTDLKLGISELLEDLEAEGDENIWVTLLPRSEGCINTTVDGLRIEYIR